jgi:DNA repair exonuclease SbcCD ATPase subunit
VRTQTELTSALAALRPWTGTAEALDGLQVPGAALLTSLKARIEASEANWRRAADQRTDRTRALEAARLRIEQIQRDERPVAAEELREARSRRDRLWTSIQEGLETGDIDASRGQVEPFEASMAQTDQLADRRFDRAAQSADLTRSLHEVERLQLELSAAKEKEEVLSQERAAVFAELTRARETLGLPATTVAEIEEWLRVRTTALAKAASQREAAATVEAFEAELDKAIDALRQAIGDTVGRLGSNGLEGFAALLQQAELLLAQQQENVQKCAVFQQQLSRGQKEATDLEIRLEPSLAELNAWREAWGACPCSKVQQAMESVADEACGPCFMIIRPKR